MTHARRYNSPRIRPSRDNSQEISISRRQWDRIRQRKNRQLSGLRASLNEARELIQTLQQTPTDEDNTMTDNPTDNTTDNPTVTADEAITADTPVDDGDLATRLAEAEARAAEAEKRAADAEATAQAQAAQEAYRALLSKLDRQYGGQYRADAITTAEESMAELGYGEDNVAPAQLVADRLEIAYLQLALAAEIDRHQPAAPAAETLDTAAGGAAGIHAAEGTLEEVLADMTRNGKLR